MMTTEELQKRVDTENFQARVAEFRRRLYALQDEFKIDLRHEDNQGEFMCHDFSDDSLWDYL